MGSPAMVTWGHCAAIFDDAREADEYADLLRRMSSDTVTVEPSTVAPSEVADIESRLKEEIECGEEMTQLASDEEEAA